MKVTIKTSKSITIPKGCHVITNDGDFFTVAKKRGDNVIAFITEQANNVDSIDFGDADRWIELTRAEIKRLNSIK